MHAKFTHSYLYIRNTYTCVPPIYTQRKRERDRPPASSGNQAPLVGQSPALTPLNLGAEGALALWVTEQHCWSPDRVAA